MLHLQQGIFERIYIEVWPSGKNCHVSIFCKAGIKITKKTINLHTQVRKVDQAGNYCPVVKDFFLLQNRFSSKKWEKSYTVD